MAAVTGNRSGRKRFTPSSGNKGGGDWKTRPYGFNAPWKIVKFNIANPEGADVPWSPKANKEGKFDSITAQALQDIPELGVKKGDERTIVRPRNLNNNSRSVKELSKPVSGNPALKDGDLIAFEDLSDYASPQKYKIGEEGFKAPEGILFAQFGKLFEREVNLNKVDGKSKSIVHVGPVSFLPVYGKDRKTQRVRVYHDDRDVLIDKESRAIVPDDANEEQIEEAADKNLDLLCKTLEKTFEGYDYGYGVPGAMLRTFPDVKGLGKEEAIEAVTKNPDTFPAFYDVFSHVPFTTDEEGNRKYGKLTEATVKQMTDHLRKLREDFKVLDPKVNNGESLTEEELNRHEEAAQFQDFLDGASSSATLLEVLPTSSIAMGKMSLAAKPGKMSIGEIASLTSNTAYKYPDVSDDGEYLGTQVVSGRGGIQNGAIAGKVKRDTVIKLADGKEIPVPEGVKTLGSKNMLVDSTTEDPVALDENTGKVSEEGTIKNASLSEPQNSFVSSFTVYASGRSPAAPASLYITPAIKKAIGPDLADSIKENVRLVSMEAHSEAAKERKAQQNEASGQEKKEPEKVTEEPEHDEPSSDEPDADVPF